jgi:hypothetical protein
MQQRLLTAVQRQRLSLAAAAPAPRYWFARRASLSRRGARTPCSRRRRRRSSSSWTRCGSSSGAGYESCRSYRPAAGGTRRPAGTVRFPGLLGLALQRHWAALSMRSERARRRSGLHGRLQCACRICGSQVTESAALNTQAQRGHAHLRKGRRRARHVRVPAGLAGCRRDAVDARLPTRRVRARAAAGAAPLRALTCIELGFGGETLQL